MKQYVCKVLFLQPSLFLSKGETSRKDLLALVKSILSQ